MAYLLLINLFLQSCNHLANPLGPLQEMEVQQERRDNNQELAKAASLIEIAEEQKFVAQGGHMVSFYEEAGQLKATVEESLPQGFNKNHTDLPVYLAPDISKPHLANLSQAAQKRVIQVTLPKRNQPGHVYVGTRGLKGGMVKEEDEPVSPELVEQIQDIKEEKKDTANNNKPSATRMQVNMDQPRLLLSLDGGGIRGLLEAYLLSRLETTVESKINEHFKGTDAPAPDVRLGECFDVVSGTSTGGIIALGMRVLDPITHRPKYKMQELLELYEKKGDTIFPVVSTFSGWLLAKHDPQPLENLFQEYFGKATLKDLDPTKLTIITGYDADQEGLYLFRNYAAQRDERHNYHIKDVARATSAAPTYFPATNIISGNGENHLFVDGGVAANNPTFHAYKEARKEIPNNRWQVISLGTGAANLFTLRSKESGGKLQWASDISSVVMNSTSKLVDEVAEYSIEGQGDDYMRLQFELDQQAAALDDATPDNVNRLKGYVKRKIEERDPVLTKITNSLLDLYKSHDYYVFYPLVNKAREQVANNNGQVTLAGHHLSARAMWEVIHALSLPTLPQVTHLDLSKNHLSATSLGYIGKLTAITSLNLSNTHLTIEGLKLIRKASLPLHTLTARQNPDLEAARDEELVYATERYTTNYLDPMLHHRLGNYYARQGNTAKAIKLYGDSQDPLDQLTLAKLHLSKSAADPEFDKGFKKIQALADQGYVEAQYMLGHFYHRLDQEVFTYLLANQLIPKGGSKVELERASLLQAEHWYKLAAHQKNKNAAKALGDIYESRRILVPITEGKSCDERHQLGAALKYYRLAKEAGSTSVDKHIERLEKQLRDIVDYN